MQNDFIQVGKPIKIEVNIIPSYLFFKGVIEKIENNVLLIKIDGQYVQKDPQTVKCTISNNAKTKVCLFETIVQYGSNDQLILAMPNKDKVKVTQRREYIRVAVNKEVNCYLVGINDKKVESNKIFPAIVKDISGGGVLLNSALSLPIGTVLVFEIELDRDKFLLTIKVLRNLENEDDETKNLGCQFIGIDEGDRQMIIAYCNREQLIIKRRDKITG